MGAREFASGSSRGEAGVTAHDHSRAASLATYADPLEKEESSDDSLGSEETIDMHRLYNFVTQLRLVQRDMIRVLNLPTEGNTEAVPARQSFKRRTAPVEPKPVFFYGHAPGLMTYWLSPRPVNGSL